MEPNFHDAFWLSEVLEEAGVKTNSQFFTIWQRSYDTILKSYHALYRRNDHALSFDDSSEGTLQVDPQIGTMDYQKFANVLMQFFQETGMIQTIPENSRKAMLQQLMRRLLEMI